MRERHVGYFANMSCEKLTCWLWRADMSEKYLTCLVLNGYERFMDLSLAGEAGFGGFGEV